MAKFSDGATLNVTRSEVIEPFAGMVASGLPVNVSATSEFRSIEAPPTDLARRAVLITNAPLLYSLESRKRTFSPPIDTCTIWRNVLLLRPGEGGLFAVSTSCSDVAQVPTQCFAVMTPLLDELELDVLEVLEELLELDELELLVELLELELLELPPTSPPQAAKVRAKINTRHKLKVVCM